jgi:hypothetical protein
VTAPVSHGGASVTAPVSHVASVAVPVAKVVSSVPAPVAALAVPAAASGGVVGWGSASFGLVGVGWFGVGSGLDVRSVVFPWLLVAGRGAGLPVAVASSVASVGGVGAGRLVGMVSVVAPLVGGVGSFVPGSGVPVGVGGVGGGFGLFFFFVGALVAVAGLFSPRVVGALWMGVGVVPPQPFVCLLERPG